MARETSYTTEGDGCTVNSMMPYGKLARTLVHIESSVRVSVEEEKIAGLFIDGLHGLFLFEKKERVELGKILLFNRLKALAIELNIPIIVTLPLSRKPKYYDELISPLISELKLNDSIVEIIDSIFLMYRLDYYKVEYGRWRDPYGIEHIKIAKNRYGDIGKVKLRNYYQRCCMVDVVENAEEKMEELIWKLGLVSVDEEKK